MYTCSRQLPLPSASARHAYYSRRLRTMRYYNLLHARTAPITNGHFLICVSQLLFPTSIHSNLDCSSRCNWETKNGQQEDTPSHGDSENLPQFHDSAFILAYKLTSNKCIMMPRRPLLQSRLDWGVFFSIFFWEMTFRCFAHVNVCLDFGMRRNPTRLSSGKVGLSSPKTNV